MTFLQSNDRWSLRDSVKILHEVQHRREFLRTPNTKVDYIGVGTNSKVLGHGLNILWLHHSEVFVGGERIIEQVCSLICGREAAPMDHLTDRVPFGNTVGNRNVIRNRCEGSHCFE